MADAPVSFIIAAYQGEAYVGDAIESVLAQTRVPQEIFVVNDGSTDRTSEIVTDFCERDARVQLIEKANGGAGSARNAGIARATQPFTAFLDHDDLATPVRIEKQLEEFDGDAPPDIVFGGMEQFVSPEIPADVAARFRFEPGPSPSPLPSCLMARSKVFEIVGGMVEGDIATFVDWYLRALENDLVIKTSAATVCRRRIHGNNESLQRDQLQRSYIRVIKASLDRRRAKGEA